MKITCAISQTVPYTDADGKVKQCVLRPGKHVYNMLRPKSDPVAADALRVLRKHAKITFDDLLPSDAKILARCPDGVDRTEFLAAHVLLDPNPVGRVVTRRNKFRKIQNAIGSRQKNPTPQEPQISVADSRKPRKVSDKK